jgi:hypothetical protein
MVLLDVNVTDHWLFLQRMPRLQLQKLNLTKNAIDHASQMTVAAIMVVPGGGDNEENESSLLELNLSRNKIQRPRAGQVLATI